MVESFKKIYKLLGMVIVAGSWCLSLNAAAAYIEFSNTAEVSVTVTVINSDYTVPQIVTLSSNTAQTFVATPDTIYSVTIYAPKAGFNSLQKSIRAVFGKTATLKIGNDGSAWVITE